MIKENITLSQLKYVIALDDYRNFSRAAEQCHITQPTLSLQLKKLENTVDLIIFDRSKKPVVPTSSGLLVIDSARRILKEVDLLAEEITLMNEDLHGEISIGIIPTLAPYLIPFFIRNFSRQFPKIDIQVKELFTESIVEGLKKDKIDVGLLVGPLEEQGVNCNPLFYEEILVYIHPNHPFSSQEEIYLDQLQSEQLWILGQGHCFRDQVLNLCPESKVERKKNIKYDCGSLETLKKLVDLEGGFTLLPELSIGSLIPGEKTRVKPIYGPKPLRQVCMATARSVSRRKVMGILDEFIKASVPAELLDPGRGKLIKWQS